ncbi:hypothetical protein Tco_1194186 [Tanacetum coccineum]
MPIFKEEMDVKQMLYATRFKHPGEAIEYGELACEPGRGDGRCQCAAGQDETEAILYLSPFQVQSVHKVAALSSRAIIYAKTRCAKGINLDRGSQKRDIMKDLRDGQHGLDRCGSVELGIREEAQAENQQFLDSIDEGMKKVIKEQVKSEVSKITPKIEKLVNEQLELSFPGYYLRRKPRPSHDVLLIFPEL